ncbi:TetR/AcrR family transcriptional regulator [Pseudonocardia sp. ICBG1293]|uniref:TetR/AcrR family transcriptional regulator n=1 Tax=Pseudonocardia sp. ICBG1293 TaxID=2844382 RepID=UPI001CC9DAE4|nr:TetR/AcrR family transcriptional regulator [Pseudonocardia sp. ICBG1293]
MDEGQRRELSSRNKVLLAAMELFGQDPGGRLSVRAVAARAGVSTGSLRHHFPTQRALQDEVLTRVYDLVVPDGAIHDTSVPARDRLADCLREVLSRTGVGDQARRSLQVAVETFVAPEPTEQNRAAYLAIEREMQRRVEYWLTTLVEQGALAPGDTTRRARFLTTVVNGLTLERALPAADPVLRAETETLRLAVDAVLGDAPGHGRD